MLDTDDLIDHQRWLIDNGFINDLHKDNLFVYGTLVHKEVEAVEVQIDITNKMISYDIYIGKNLRKRMERFEALSKSNGVIDLWLLRRILRKEGNLNFLQILNGFVKTYLGPKWSVTAKMRDIKEYEEGIKEQTPGDTPDNKSTIQ